MTEGERTYERIAADLRAAIERGDYRDGDRLPGENATMTTYGVARATAREALGVLRYEGLAVARLGSGTFVAARDRIVRDSRGRYARVKSAPPFKSDTKSAGQAPDWAHESRPMAATAETARRLGIRPGDSVMETTYLFRANDRPIQLSRSWEPLTLTVGTPIELPEAGAAVGVITRFDLIGVSVTRVIERVTSRAATREEARQLDLPARGAYVLVIDRTHYADERAVETCDIVFPGNRYELTYEIPVD